MSETRDKIADIILSHALYGDREGFAVTSEERDGWQYEGCQNAADAVIAHLAARQNHTENGAVVTDAGTVEWGVRFKRDGLIENYPTRERAAARAAEFSTIESRDHRVIEEIPPSDPERGRALVRRTVSEWVEVPNE